MAVTPTKSREMDFKDVKRVCHDYTMLGLKTIDEARGKGLEPLRFVYVSGGGRRGIRGRDRVGCRSIV